MSSFFVSSKQLNLTALATSLDGNLNLGVYVKVEDVVITNIKTLKEAQPNSLSFYNNYKYLEDLFKSKTGVCLIEQNTLDDLKQQYLDKIKHITFLVVKNAYLSFAKAGNIFYADTVKTSFISPLAFIDKTAKIGDNVSIKEFAVIGANVIIADGVFVGSNSNIYENVEIAENTVIHSNVSIKYSKIGKNCIIHDGVRIGQDGFGFAPNPTGHIKILQIGGVIIEDNVEIGANTTIDRGALENTEIGFGTKIDNLVQIAHGVKIGKHCFIAAQVGIAGSAVLEDLVFIGGGTGISPHITIEKGKQIVPQSGVMDDIKGEPILMGYPAIGKADFFKTQVLLKRLLKEYKNKKQ